MEHKIQYLSINEIVDNKMFSVDESMVPYFGNHGSRQFIYGKPIRYGFKVWAICTSDGAALHLEPYCGKSNRIHDFGLGQGPNVVLNCRKRV